MKFEVYEHVKRHGSSCSTSSIKRHGSSCSTSSIKRHESSCSTSSIKRLSINILGLLILVIHLQLTNASDEIRVGGLFEKLDINEEVAFKQAVDAVNKDENLLPHAKLSARIKRIQYDNPFVAAKKVCTLLKRGVGAIFGPQSAKTSTHVESICASMAIPHIVNRRDFTQDEYSVNLYPHSSTLAKAYTEVVKSLGWNRFWIIYENNNGLFRVQELMKDEKFHVILKQLPYKDYFPLFKEAKEEGVTNLVLDVETENIFWVLKAAQQAGMMTSYHKYFITSLDLHTIDLEDFQNEGTSITALQLVNPQDPVLQQIHQELQNISNKDKIMEGDYPYLEQIYSLNGQKTEVALMYDAVHLFAKALDDLEQSISINITSLECDGDATWADGASLLNYIRKVEINGLSGLIRFDSEGFRSDVTLDVIKLSKHGLTKIGSWVQFDMGFNQTRSYTGVQAEVEESIKDKTLIVTTVLAEPYVMLRDTSYDYDYESSINDPYEGLCIDILNEISTLLGFTFHIVPPPDNQYGSLNSKTNQWNGMIGDLITHRADLAIGDLTITYDREQVVDFTQPWMNTGISILYRRPTRIPARYSYYNFFSPFTLEVWIYVALAYVGVSLLLFALARLSPYEGVAKPSITKDNSTKIENQFSLDNSLWFTVGSVLQQQTDQQPRAASTRIVSGIWWMFVIIMICSYTANLAAFYIKDAGSSKRHFPIKSIDDLASQTDIKYGTIKGGSTWNFFATSEVPTYQRIANFMESEYPSVYENTSEDAWSRVSSEEGGYAFLMETASIEYIVERNCNLMQIGGDLDSRSYGIALPPGSPYQKFINGAILRLQQDGILHKLKKKWWREMRGGGRCKTGYMDPEFYENPHFNELSLWNIGGLFEILLVGLGLASVVSISEFLWNYLKRRRISIPI